MNANTPSDRELLRAVYRRLNVDALLKDFPGMDPAYVKAFFRRVFETLPEDARDSAEGDASAAPAEQADRVILYTDGGSRGNPGPAGFGVVVTDPAGRVLAERDVFMGRASNNEAEYGGLVAGLELCHDMGAQNVLIRADSQLMIRQINGEYKVKSPNLKPLFEQARALLGHFPQWRAEHVRREQNKLADALANKAMDRGA